MTSVVALRNAYERYSAGVPYFPQLVMIVLIAVAMIWSSLMTFRYFLEYTAASGHIPTVVRWDLAKMLEPPFWNAASSLLTHLAIMVVMAVLLSLMPVYNEGFRKPPASAIGRMLENVTGTLIVVASMALAVIYNVWLAILVVFMYIPGVLGMVFNIIFTLPALILIAVVHIFAGKAIFKATFGMLND